MEKTPSIILRYTDSFTSNNPIEIRRSIEALTGTHRTITNRIVNGVLVLGIHPEGLATHGLSHCHSTLVPLSA